MNLEQRALRVEIDDIQCHGGPISSGTKIFERILSRSLPSSGGDLLLIAGVLDAMSCSV
jgi:hypothetical protein